MSAITTHVLDTSRGLPAAGVRIELHRVDAGTRRALATALTTADGRTAEPLLSADRLETGVYELTFHAGAYFLALKLKAGARTGDVGDGKIFVVPVEHVYRIRTADLIG